MKEDSDEVKALKKRIARQERDLLEYYRTEQVLIAAGYVTRDRFDKAHEIVRDLLT